MAGLVLQAYHTAADRLQLIPATAKHAAGVQFEVRLDRSGATVADIMSVDLKVTATPATAAGTHACTHACCLFGHAPEPHGMSMSQSHMAWASPGSHRAAAQASQSGPHTMPWSASPTSCNPPLHAA